MRGKVRYATVGVGVGTVVVLILLAMAAITGSAALAVVAGVLGVVMAALFCVVALRIADRFVKISDRQATRLKNLEKHCDGLTESIDLHDQRIGQVGDEIDATRHSVSSVQVAFEAAGRDLARARRDIQVLRSRVPAEFLDTIKQEVAGLQSTSREAVRSSFESAIQLGRDPHSVISERLARQLFRDYLSREDFLRLRPLIENFNVLENQSLTSLRAMYRAFRSAGYWDMAATTVARVYEKSGRENDARAVAKIEHELAIFTQPTLVRPELPDGEAYDSSGPILHMVGRVLPETQTGYTLRTQYTAMAQARKGLPVAIVGQVGITEHTVEELESYQYQGIDYYLLPGAPRNTVLIDDWLRQNILELAALVREVRPSILHAQSDFFNELIIDVVGKRYGIPTVYESRGFWEESWLSRTITAKGWGDQAEQLFSTYGLPAAYSLRKHAEEVARTLPDHVFTLADVMKHHIVDSAHGAIRSDAVSIVPNAVETENFPVQAPDLDLARQIGLPADAAVVGYISSIVEYEGIDTLIDAFHLASSASARPMCLLLVGDGDYLDTLRSRVESRGISNVFFTGRVPHEDVLKYYGLIDLFVVPRKKSAVADLVTPLKPFEAFSTGRAVVLSDVGALKEIADQSRAVETFRAGDPDDLARIVVALIEDPERRRELSRRAARWVRNHRSWDGNVNEYYRVYKKLGFTGPRNLLVESELDLEQRGVNPGELLEKLGSADLPPLKGWFTIQDIRQSANSVVEDGWRFASFEPVPVASIEDWAYYGNEHRSWGFHLHAWEFMDPMIRAYDDTGEVMWLDQAVRIARGWIEIHREADDESDPMAWYDMSQSLRTPRLIALTLRASRVSALRDQAVILAEALAWHLDELHKDRAFNPNNNHGFYTAVSQVHAAKYAGMLPGSENAGTEGRARLAQMAMAQFAPDGVHLEHSPDYHRMLLNSFELAVQDGLIEDEDVKGRVERAAHVLGWMVQPDGALVQFGDSPETKIVRPDATSIDAQTQFILSDGEKGERPSDEMAVYPEGGYAFVRSPQPDGPGTLRHSGYLAFSTAFHSRAHKHADDLNVVWYDRGQQILTDGGRFGYGDLLPPESPLRRRGFYYAAPERQYIEGTMAHNTLMMDGRDQERRTRQPYGSGLTECTEAEGTFDLSGRVHHADYIHRRRVIYRPGEELRLLDSVFSQSTDEREATLWLNVSGHFELEDLGEDLVFASDVDGQRTILRINGPGRLIEPVRGQTEPLRGWRSRHDRSLEPTWSIGFTVPVEIRASVETKLRLE